MTANVPPMKTWAEHHLASIFKAPTQPEFTDAFDAFLSAKATVTVNGKDISVEQYKNMLQEEKSNQTSASIKFHSAVDVPADNSSVQTGMVGLFYTAIISELDIRAAEKDITSSMNLFIGEDRSVEPPGIDPFFDRTAFRHRSLHQGKQQVRFEEADAAVRFAAFRPHVDGPPSIFNYLHPHPCTSIYPSPARANSLQTVFKRFKRLGEDSGTAVSSLKPAKFPRIRSGPKHLVGGFNSWSLTVAAMVFIPLFGGSKYSGWVIGLNPSGVIRAELRHSQLPRGIGCKPAPQLFGYGQVHGRR
ncbi:hypothetical protein C8R45DRAFT_1081764 [Mycena sanguinolenta]|nr:hypothetical protein C8R45DRAFT_1081764 [Mycena sanguinolenta]